LIRKATPEDAKFLIDLAKTSYPNFDEPAAYEWLGKAMQLDNYAVFRGERCGGVMMVNGFFYNPSELRGFMLYCVAYPKAGWEVFRLFKAMIDWALNEKMAASVHFGSETGVNFAPFAKRLGGSQDTPSWTVKRDGKKHS
jgi:hypothetical protein